MSSIKFLPIQQGKHFLSVSFCSYQPLTLYPSLTPWSIVTPGPGDRSWLLWVTAVWAKDVSFVLFCFLLRTGLSERGLWVKWCLQPNPRKHNIAPLLLERMQANSLFVFKHFVFFNKFMSHKKGGGGCLVLKENFKA